MKDKLYLVFGTLYANGFYRSMISESLETPKNPELVVHKFFRGFIFGIAYATWYSPMALYQIIGRTEIWLTNKNPQDYKEYYNELLFYTSLPRKD